MADAPATVVIASATIAGSLLVLVLGWLPQAALTGGFLPARLDGVMLPAGLAWVVPVWLTPLSATLLHGSGAHLALNMVMLLFCGVLTERAIGPRAMAILYVVGAYAAAAVHWMFDPMSAMPMIGASGAVSAVVAAHALLYGQPKTKAVGPISANVVHVAWLATAWIGIQALIGLAGLAGGGAAIAIGAHIGGFIAGLAIAKPLLMWRYHDA